uniref:Uncharacterized protein n=1 Tax=Eubacterium cellulosolvens (strain ATCC 43171 / JCM 9499 / 6) TaxID=633697 RepID=I5AXE5_EUBC6
MATNGNGYKVMLGEASTAASELETILEDLQGQIQDMTKCREEFLNDSLWYGPKKTEFNAKFENYMDFVNKLQGNGREYKTALEGMIRDYQE